MANSDSLVSVASAVDTACNAYGERSSFLRDRRNAGHVGLSATVDPASRGVCQMVSRELEFQKEPGAHQTADIDVIRDSEALLLTDLLAQVAPGRAHEFSRALIAKHGSLASLLLDAQQNHPLKVDLPVSAIARIKELTSILLQTWEVAAYRGPVLSSSRALHRYLQLDMATMERENFRVLFLNAANHLLLDRILWEGTVNKVQAHPREILRLAILNDATALILAHNHPSGNAHPSRDDYAITRQIVEACAPLDIMVHDHLIVTRSGVRSLLHSKPPNGSTR